MEPSLINSNAQTSYRPDQTSRSQVQPYKKPLSFFKDPERSLEQEITAHLGDFDFISLLRLLKAEGFKEQNIWFSSHNSIASQKRIIESIQLRQQYVFIEVNLGLLAPTGVLPSHIRQFMDRPDVNDQALQLFLQFFDHLLVVSYLGQLYPQINRNFFSHWEHTKTCYVTLQNMRSQCSLHWLFEYAFPEFRIILQPGLFSNPNSSHLPVLGKVQLGYDESVTQPGSGTEFIIYLIQHPETRDSGLANNFSNWSQQLRARLYDLIFPWLYPLMINLDIYLCTYHQPTHLKLHQKSTLGYEPFFNTRDRIRHNEMEPRLQCTPLHTGLVQDAFAQQVNNAGDLQNSHSTQDINWGESCRLQL